MNLFAISSILVSLASILVGLFIFSQNTKSRFHLNWLALSFVISLWGLGLYGVTSATSVEAATNWQHLLDVAAIWIPPFALNFAVSFLAAEKQKRRIYVFLQYVTIAIAGILTYLSFTNLYIEGFTNEFSFFWIQPGALYILFPLFFVVISLVFEYIFLSEFLNKDNPIRKRRQALSLFIAGFFGFGGGATNFFPQFFDIYPFGNYFVILFVFFVGYSIITQKLFSTKIIAAQLFASAFGLVFVLNLLQSETLVQWYVNIFALIFVIIFGILLVRSVYKEVDARNEVERLASDLRKANTRLKELDTLKSQFLSIASHDLRAPLTAIRNFMATLIEGTYGKLPPAAEEGTEQVFNRASEMAEMVDNYLNVSRIEQGRMKYDLEDIDFAQILNETLESFEPVAREKGLTFNYTELTEPLQMKLDGSKMKEVLENLINNSINYTPEGSITVAAEKLDTRIRIAFEDTGIGMDQKTIGNLFKFLTPGEDSRKYNPKSTGVGLYITKAHIDAHGGKIWAESDGKGKGSRFIVELPLSQ